MIEKLLENIYVIHVPLTGSPLKNINSYLIKGTNRNLLIDTGFNTKECYAVLTEGLKELNVARDKTDIFITHFHTDHSGLASIIASDTSKVYISEADKRALDNMENWDKLSDRDYSLGMPQAEIEINKKESPIFLYRPKMKRAYTIIKDKDQIDLGNYILDCVSTPGHTQGHMCLYNKENKLFFSGDHIIFDITPNITSRIQGEDVLGDYLNSLQKIKSLDVEYTFSAHRTSTGNFVERIDDLIKHHKERLEEVYEIIKLNGSLNPYEAAARMSWSIRARDWSEFPVVQKRFATGEAAAHLEHLFYGGRLEREIKDQVHYYKLA